MAGGFDPNYRRPGALSSWRPNESRLQPSSRQYTLGALHSRRAPSQGASRRLGSSLLVIFCLLLSWTSNHLSAAEPGAASPEELTVAFAVFKDAQATSEQVASSAQLLIGNLNNPNMPGDVRAQIWVVAEAGRAVDRVHLINNVLLPFYSALKKQGVDFANATHINQIRQRGFLNYRTQFPANGQLQPYVGMNEAFWSNLSKHEAEAIGLFVAGKNAEAVAALPETPGAADAAATAGTPPPAAQPAASPAEPSFKPGDGSEKATQYLAKLNLVQKADIWILPGEAELKAKIKAAVKANFEFNKARKRVSDIAEAMPQVDVLDEKLQKKIGELNGKIGEKEFWGQNADGLKKKREAYQKQVDAKVTPVRKAFEDANSNVDTTYDVCAKLLDEAEEMFDKLGERYGELTEDELIFDAIGEAGGSLGPSAQLNKQFKQIAKLRKAFERNATN